MNQSNIIFESYEQTLENKDTPLVSVVVITYNSCDTVLDTLESIKAQTYRNIELIITDDCSSDSTVKLCERWLNENSRRFVHCVILSSDSNRGVSANINGGIHISKGEWIKSIAGDDKLFANCIESNIEYILLNQNVFFLFSRLEPFGKMDFFNKIERRFQYGFFYLKPKQQYHRLLLRNAIPAPTAFIRRRVFSVIGLYDEKIPLMEDWPFWLKALDLGYSLSFMNRVTVYYRVGNSLTTSDDYSALYKQTVNLFEQLLNSYRSRENVMLRHYYKLRDKERNGKSLFLFLQKIVNPYSYYFKFISLKEENLGRKLSDSIIT